MPAKISRRRQSPTPSLHAGKEMWEKKDSRRRAVPLHSMVKVTRRLHGLLELFHMNERHDVAGHAMTGWGEALRAEARSRRGFVVGASHAAPPLSYGRPRGRPVSVMPSPYRPWA